MISMYGRMVLESIHGPGDRGSGVHRCNIPKNEYTLLTKRPTDCKEVPVCIGCLWVYSRSCADASP